MTDLTVIRDLLYGAYKILDQLSVYAKITDNKIKLFK